MLGNVGGQAGAQERNAALAPAPVLVAQSVAGGVSRIAHPYDPAVLDVGGAARVQMQPDAYRKPYEQYLGGWSAPPPQLVSTYAPPGAAPPSAPLAPLPQVVVPPAPQPPAAAQVAQSATPQSAAPRSAAPQTAQATAVPPSAEPRLRYGEGSMGGVSELRFGVLAHNIGLIAESTEDGAQINIEARFRSPDFMKVVLSPRPTLGASINTAGDTSFVYAGLTWGGFVWKGLFIEGFVGLAAHDGELNSNDPEPHDRRQMGSRVVFREAIEIGYRFLENHSVSIMLDHYSNAGLFADRNQGNDDVGLRYGYKF